MKDEYDLSTMKSRKNPYASKLKKSVTMRLGEDVISYFKSMAEESGVPYRSLINCSSPLTGSPNSGAVSFCQLERMTMASACTFASSLGFNAGSCSSVRASIVEARGVPKTHKLVIASRQSACASHRIFFRNSHADSRRIICKKGGRSRAFSK